MLARQVAEVMVEPTEQRVLGPVRGGEAVAPEQVMRAELRVGDVQDRELIPAATRRGGASGLARSIRRCSEVS